MLEVKVDPFTYKGDSEEEVNRFRHYLIGKSVFEKLSEFTTNNDKRDDE